MIRENTLVQQNYDLEIMNLQIVPSTLMMYKMERILRWMKAVGDGSFVPVDLSGLVVTPAMFPEEPYCANSSQDLADNIMTQEEENHEQIFDVLEDQHLSFIEYMGKVNYNAQCTIWETEKYTDMLAMFAP